MWIRILAAVVGLPIMIVLVWLGGMPFNLLIAAITGAAAAEIYISCGLKNIRAWLILLIFILAISSVSILRENFGLWHVWFVFIAAWGSDTGAYFVGRTIGKRKLAPKLSPKKTVEGAIGGIIIAAGLLVLYGFILNSQNIFNLTTTDYIALGIFGATGAVLGQAGDLFASSIKRRIGIKDYGKIIPGHGGVLDRFDSILFTAPATLIFVQFIFTGYVV